MSRLVGPPDDRGHCDGIAVRLCSAMTGAGWEVGPGGVSSAPFLGLALRLGWATLRPVPSSGIRGPYTRRSARSSRLSLSVDHMALRDRWAAAAAAACSLISGTLPALNRLPLQGRHRTNKCRCAAAGPKRPCPSRGGPARAQGWCRCLPPLSRFRGRCCCSRGVRAGWATTPAATVTVGILFLCARGKQARYQPCLFAPKACEGSSYLRMPPPRTRQTPGLSRSRQRC